MFTSRALQRRGRAIAFAALVIAALTWSVVNPAQPGARVVEAQTAPLPPLPARWPSTLQLGTADSPGGAAAMKAIAPFGFRYQYLSGGANTGNGWANWNGGGQFATYYIQDSIANGITPVFTYYMIYQSSPGGGGEGNAITTNLRNTSTMTAYFNDLKLFFQRAGAFPNSMVVLHVEPDMWGYIQQRSTGDDARTFEVKVAATGIPELQGLPNTAAGLAQAIKRLRDANGGNVVLAYPVSVWGTGNDIVYSDPPDSTVDNLGTRAGNFYLSLNTKFDISFSEFSDRDAAFKQYQYGDGGAAWWNASDFARNVRFLSRFVSTSQTRVVMWQIPLGNTKMRAMNNTWNHYQDNRVEWLLDEPARTHLNQYLQAGVVGFLFGRGANGATCSCDAQRDGVTNPAAINGNNRLSINADDDGGFFREKALGYYSTGLLTLPSSGGSNPPTPTRTPLPTPTRTPTPGPGPSPSTPTPVPTVPTGSQTVTFDSLPNAGRALSGQHPTGLIEWGTNAWYLSRPWGRFTTNSVSFNGSSATSASFQFVGTQRRLVSVQAYNGGGSASTVTLSCAGQTKQTSVPAGQLVTISTGWTGTCSTVTVGSSNRWDTNFDNFVVQ